MLKHNLTIYKLLLLLTFSAFSSISFGQTAIKIANKLFKSEKYCDAIKYYNKHLSNFADDDAYMKRGICNYHCKHFKNAVEDLNNSVLMGNDDARINYYLAKTYHNQQNFEKAIIYYKKHLNEINGNKTKKKETLNQIKRCANAVKLKYKPASHFIENWGSGINTEYDDILPIQSPGDVHHFYFSSNRIYNLKKTKQYKEFQVDFSDGEWEKLYDIFSSQNNKNTVFLDFFNGNNKIAYFMGPSLFMGSIFTSDYSRASKRLDTDKRLEAPIKAEYGFRHLQFINDSTIVFSSDMEGGYGGYDLYLTGFRNGKWFEPVNLGNKVNSKFDEISPYITKDGEYLYFSSNNLNSTGGFDVFRSRFSYADDDWSIPENLGFPISSPADEIGFRVLSSGKGGIFNSDRKDMGFGGHDLYWIYFKKLVDTKRAYANEIPYLRNRHLKLIDIPVVEDEKEIIVADNTPPASKNTTEPVTDNNLNVDKKPVADKKKATKITVKTKKPSTTEIPDPKPESTKKPKDKVVVKTPEKKKKDTAAKTYRPKKKITKNKKSVFTIPLIFIKDKKFRDNKTVTEFIDKTAVLMKKNPELIVEFVGNAFEWQSDKSELLNSLRFTEGLADSLTLRMIEPERIILKGVGSSLPAAKPYGPKRSKNIIVKANNRIDVFFHNTKDLPVNIKQEGMYISRSIEDSRYKLYRTIIKGLTYKIQVKEGDFLFLVDLLDKYRDSGIEKDVANKKYYYTVGLYKEYISAKDLYKKILASGYNNIKIIPYIDGVRIDKKDILNKAKTYIDLVNYIEDNKNL